MPPPDFPRFDDIGESKFISKGLPEHLESTKGQSAMGLKPLDISITSLKPGEKETLAKANVIFGFGDRAPI
jgi:hypothetical protein